MSEGPDFRQIRLTFVEEVIEEKRFEVGSFLIGFGDVTQEDALPIGRMIRINDLISTPFFLP